MNRGGIGWGAPEAMGEIMAVCGVIAREYYKILISYIMPERNYLEHPELQKGVLWGIGRLSECQPELIQSVLPYLEVFMVSPDIELRGLSAWAACNLGADGKKQIPPNLFKDQSEFYFFHNGNASFVKIGHLLVSCQA